MVFLEITGSGSVGVRILASMVERHTELMSEGRLPTVVRFLKPPFKVEDEYWHAECFAEYFDEVLEEV